MLPKKNPFNDLESYRTHFMLTGLALALLLVIWLFNIKFFEETPEPVSGEVYQLENTDDVIPITHREPPKKVSAPQLMPEQIDLVDDAVEIEDDFEFAETETDENEAVTSKTYQVTDGPVEVVEVEMEEEPDLALAFAVVESPPVFPGCEGMSKAQQRHCFQEKTMQFVMDNFHYSSAARTLQLSGRVFVQFVVEKDGRISNAEVVRGLDPILDEEALRVVNNLPQMQPAQQRGVPVRMKFMLPIKLVLQ